ncbi:MAG TPA: 50S ribosomal protein L6 [Candidatus Aminicenantes bacterium]|nr:50S ribosomal protein L6 [Candidatus Aminicenantes bacterium]HPT00449.1 50S ribosomal protein L6 [Candidatus Aminicenantes bacterium]
MSRIGKQPIEIPKGVKVDMQEGTVHVEGPKGKLTVPLLPELDYKVEAGNLTVSPKNLERRARSMWGLSRTLINNAVQGVTQGYTRSLQVVGSGYRVQLEGKNLVFAIGFSHPVTVVPPEGISFTVKDPANFSIAGIDKQLVGQIAANIRSIRPPEPYKLKGIRYVGEKLIQKERKLGAK